MTETALNLDALSGEITATLEELHARRALLSLDVLAGDEPAARELAELDEEIGKHAIRAELAELARDERARRDAEQADHDERERRERADADAERAEEERETALKTLQTELYRLAETVRVFTEAEDALQNASVRAGRRFVSRRETAAELIVIAARDAGLDEPLPYVRASVRASLLAQFPLPVTPPATPTTSANGERVTVAACTVCGHASRSVIEDALRAGSSYREVESAFGVSRSALSRHARHA